MERRMVLWPMLSLIGFLALTGLVIAMGTQSTARYEAEKRAASGPRARHATADTRSAVPANAVS